MNKKLFSMAVLLAVLISGTGLIPVLAQSVSPVSDFEYDLNGDGTGVVILKYVGKGGDIVPLFRLDADLITKMSKRRLRRLSFPTRSPI